MTKIFSIINMKTQKFILADSGNIFKTEDINIAEEVYEKLEKDGADMSNLYIVEYK